MMLCNETHDLLLHLLLYHPIPTRHESCWRNSSQQSEASEEAAFVSLLLISCLKVIRLINLQAIFYQQLVVL